MSSLFPFKTNPIRHTNKYFLITLVFFIIPISGLPIDIFVPSLPALKDYFHIEKSLAQWSVTSYMLGLGMMQFFAGAISDSFGRRKPFLIGMFFFIVITLVIPHVHTIEQLLVLRFVQGLLTAILVVPLRSLPSDLFEGKEYYKMITYMTTAWSIGPIIAPFIGGYLQYYFNWQANFYFLAGYSAISFILLFIYLPETSLHKHPFSFYSILKRYKAILTNKEFLKAIAIDSSLFCFIILFAVIGSFLIQITLHHSSIEFGHIALLTGLIWFLGGITNRFLTFIPLKKKSLICMGGMLLGVLSGVLFNIVFTQSLYTIVIPVLILLFFGGILFPNYFAHAIALFPKNTGSANALFGGLLFSLSGVITSLVSLVHINNAVLLFMVYGLIVMFCFLVREI